MQKRRICKYKFVENILKYFIFKIIFKNFKIILSELNLLQGLTHPFICSLWYAFQVKN